jgi:hypothetical protein
MSQLRITSHIDAVSWNDSLTALGGTIFHSAQWANATLADHPRAIPLFYTLVEDDGSVAGQAVGFRQLSARSFAAPCTGRLWFDALPAVRDGASAISAEFLRQIESASRRSGDVTMRVGSFASPGSENVLRPLGHSLSRRLEFELDLSRPEQILWESVDIKRRQRIRKAMRNGVEVRDLPADEGVCHLRRLQEASFVRVVARGGPPLGKRDAVARDPIHGLVASGAGRIVGGFVGGECVSASFFSTFNGLAYYALSGHDDTALTSQAPSLVLWEMVLRLQQEGFRKLNLGGCGIGALEEQSPEHGVYTYKKAFGGAQLDCASGEKVLRPAVRRVANLLSTVVR